MREKTGRQVPQTPQKKEKGRKPFVELVESACLSKNELLLAIRLKESPALEERSLFFTFVEQLAEKLTLIKPVIEFTTKEIHLLFDQSMPMVLLRSFMEELRRFLFPNREDGIHLDNQVTPFQKLSL
jgi:hypothetical protein